MHTDTTQMHKLLPIINYLTKNTSALTLHLIMHKMQQTGGTLLKSHTELSLLLHCKQHTGEKSMGINIQLKNTHHIIRNEPSTATGNRRNS